MDKKDIIAKMNAYAAHTMVEKLGFEIFAACFRWLGLRKSNSLANWKKHPGLGCSNYG